MCLDYLSRGRPQLLSIYRVEGAQGTLRVVSCYRQAGKLDGPHRLVSSTLIISWGLSHMGAVLCIRSLFPLNHTSKDDYSTNRQTALHRSVYSFEQPGLR